MTQLICGQCGKSFERRTSEVDLAIRRGSSDSYCSRACACLAKQRREIISTICQQCGCSFSRRTQGKKDRGRFCSRRCASQHSVARLPRRVSSGPVCAVCGRKSRGGDVCRSCRNLQLATRTVGELRAQFGTFAFHAKVRGLARTAYKGPRECAACGYSLHVDICHVRDVASFPGAAALSEVNDPANLIALDKRCHWEFDHGYLAYADGRIVAGAGLEPAASGLWARRGANSSNPL